MLPPVSPPTPQTPRPADGLLTPKQLARRLALSTRTLRRHIAMGTIPEPIRINRRVLRWDREVIEKWIAEKMAEKRPATTSDR